jgi:hypothetical protein
MRKSYLFLASTAILLASCANDELENGTLPLSSSDTQAIGFNLKTAGMTRATLSGSDAASKLNNEFVVYGTKFTGDDNYTTLGDDAFKNYVVKWTDNTAGTSSSNSSNWEYVGKTSYKASLVSPSLLTEDTKTGNQTIKYWDYSTARYTFTAFSGVKLLNPEGEGTTAGSVTKITGDANETSKTKYDKGYTVVIPATSSDTENTALDNIFFSDRVEVAKANYGQPVVLTFRNFGAKVRVGFYETVPGYSVKNIKFYAPTTNNSTAVTKYNDMRGGANNAFAAALLNVNKKYKATEGDQTVGNTVTVTYGNGKDGVAENQPKIDGGSTAQYQNTLTLGNNINGKTLGTTADKATWDTENGAYTTVYPNLGNTTPMLIRCDYTLVADDGSKEEINVKNARVIVPANYCQWKSNYAYTYLFKISENTNGITGTDPDKGTTPTDPEKPGIDYDNPGTTDNPEGLFPITFDAVAVESEDYKQETITTIANNSVTAYSVNSNVTTNVEYKAGNDIYFVDKSTTLEEGKHNVLAVTNGIVDINSTTATEFTKTANVYSLEGITAPTEAQVIAKLTGIENGLTLTAVSGDNAASVVSEVPSQSGPALSFGEYGAVKFKPASEGYYAYVYCSEKYVAQEYEEAASWTENTTYYFKADKTKDSQKADFYYVASNVKENNFSEFTGKLYVKKTSQSPAAAAGKYDVKVVKVVK